MIWIVRISLCALFRSTAARDFASVLMVTKDDALNQLGRLAPMSTLIVDDTAACRRVFSLLAATRQYSSALVR